MLHWVFTAVCGLSLGAASGDASPVAVRGFLPVVVPLCRSQALGLQASVAAAQGRSSYVGCV